MALLLVSFVLFLCWLLALDCVKDSLSRGILLCFLGYWTISLITSLFNPSGLYNVSIRTYFILLVHLLMFILGYIVLPSSECVISSKAGRYSIDSICTSKLFWLLYWSILIFGLITLINQRAALAFYTTGNIKVDPMNLLFEGSRLRYYFYDLVCTPFYYFSMALFSFLVIYQKRRRIEKIALFVLIIVYSLIGGGRVTIIMILFYLLFFFIAGDRISSSNYEIKKKRISIKTILLSTLIVVFLFGGMAYVTYIGKNGLEGFGQKEFIETSNDVVDQLVVYSLGPFRAFDYALNHPEVYFNSGYHFVRATFCGFDYLVSLALGVFGIHYSPINYLSLSIMQENPIQVGNNIGFNYAYTSVIYPYIDMGFIGVCFYGLLFGYLCRLIIVKAYKKSSFYYLALLSFIFYMLMYTVFSNLFNKDFSVIYIVLLLYLAKKEKRIIC